YEKLVLAFWFQQLRVVISAPSLVWRKPLVITDINGSGSKYLKERLVKFILDSSRKIRRLANLDCKNVISCYVNSHFQDFNEFELGFCFSYIHNYNLRLID